MNGNMLANIQTATKQNAISLRDAMKAKIANGDPTWPPLSPLTIKMKRSSKPLVDHGDLMHSIMAKRLSSLHFFVGVPRTETGADGVSMVNIAAVHEYGARIRPKRAKALVIPVSREAVRLARQYGGVSNIPGLFRPRHNGQPSSVLAIRVGKTGKRLRILFILRKESVIPPRSFIQSTFREELPAMQERLKTAARFTLQGRVYRGDAA